MTFQTEKASISRKLTWMNIMVSGIALLMACASFIAYDVVTFRTSTFRNLSTQAQIIGSNCISPLLFNDREAAEKTVAALKADPHIISAVVYTPSGSPFASYSGGPSVKLPPLAKLPSGTEETRWIANNQIILEHSIVFEGTPIGTVCIRSDDEALTRRLQRYLEISLLVLLASLLAALAVSSVFQRSLAKPIVTLAETAKIVSRDRSYSLRVAQVPGQGEVSVLIDAFNEMMAQIELGKAELQLAHDQLEQRVQERTAELVDAQKKVEAYSESILRAMEKVERASKFKDEFLSTMSHELRTPLNAILGFSELLADVRYGALTERQQRYVNHINISGQHLLQLINDILDLSRIEAGRLQLTFEDVPVHIPFAEVSGALQPLLDRKSQTLVQYAAPNLIVRGDSMRFRQMLMNLVGNAIKFTPEGGAIELAARQLGDFIRIDVRDSGPGIPPEEQQRIFDAFHRLKQSDKAAEGTGLGLAITRSLVELHGGHLYLESEMGSGSCFYFTLPTASKSKEKEDARFVSRVNPRTQSKVLVIDDDPAAADLLESQLASAGYEVVVCSQPQQAIETAAELQPAVITLDIVMLPVNGWDILSGLKGDPRTATIPVAVVTVTDRRAIGALLGADDYIVKPVDRSILLAAMDRCLNLRGKIEKENAILVVEDDPGTSEFVRDLLASYGYDVTTAADGAQARAWVEASLPALVILDLVLPKMSGLQLISDWRSNPRTADLPIFVLTNKDLTPDEKEYLRVNTKAFFSKQEQWLDVLIKQITQAVPLAIQGES